jgi:energy-converting hydrogenase Eha subunit F
MFIFSSVRLFCVVIVVVIVVAFTVPKTAHQEQTCATEVPTVARARAHSPKPGQGHL